MKPLQKMEFIGSSRQKFQNHRLQNYKQKPPKNAFLSHFPVVLQLFNSPINRCRSFPFDGGGGLGSDIVDDAADAWDFLNDGGGDPIQQFIG